MNLDNKWHVKLDFITQTTKYCQWNDEIMQSITTTTSGVFILDWPLKWSLIGCITTTLFVTTFVSNIHEKKNF